MNNFLTIANNILYFRKEARLFFRKHQGIFEYVFRYAISFMAFYGISHQLNYSSVLASIPASIAFGLVGMIIPSIISILLLVFVTLYEVYLASPVLSLMILAIFILMYCFAARFSGKFAYAIIAIPLLMKYNLHFLIPLVLGMTATPMAIFPVMVGVATYYVLGIVDSAVVGATINSMDDILELYINFLTSIMADREMFAVMAVFAVVIIVMWFIRRFRFSFSFEVAILVGTLFMIIGFVVANKVIPGQFRMGEVVLGTFISMLLMFIIQFFTMVLDYRGVQDVQFEDDDYYYYVKAVPKMDRLTEEHFIHKYGKVFAEDEESEDKDSADTESDEETDAEASETSEDTETEEGTSEENAESTSETEALEDEKVSESLE